jgi:hypothetical protein
LLRHGLDRIIKSSHCLIVSFPGESLTSPVVLPPPGAIGCSRSLQERLEILALRLSCRQC